MNSLAYASILCFLTVQPLLEAHYQIKNLTGNLGIYYERVQTVKIHKGRWKVVLYVDLHTFLQTHGPIRHYGECLQHCTSLFDRQHCHLFLNKDTVEFKLRISSGIHEKIKMATDSMDARESESTNVEGIRTRRMAPLGIVGSFSKSLFGLITEDDADLINENIDKLFHDQSDLVKLSEEKTHLPSAGLEELYNITASQRLLLKEMEGQLKEKINSTTQETSRNHLLWELNIFARQAEVKLDHLIYRCRELLDILNALMNRKLHTRLLQKKTLHRSPSPQGEELVKIAAIDSTYTMKEFS